MKGRGFVPHQKQGTCVRSLLGDVAGNSFDLGLIGTITGVFFLLVLASGVGSRTLVWVDSLFRWEINLKNMAYLFQIFVLYVFQEALFLLVARLGIYQPAFRLAV